MTENCRPDEARTDEVRPPAPRTTSDQPTEVLPAAAPTAPVPTTVPSVGDGSAAGDAATVDGGAPVDGTASLPRAASASDAVPQAGDREGTTSTGTAPRRTGDGIFVDWPQEGPAAPVAAAPPRGPRWLPLAGTAAGAALLASFATAGLTGAFSADATTSTPASLASIGQVSTTVPVVDSTSDDPDWEQVAAAVSAAVVAIQVTTANGGGEGSGVIIDDAGHVLTNDHVVAGAADDTVQVTLTDGRLYEATIVGLDPSTDLAVVRIVDPPEDLAVASLGDSDDVTVGSPVMAVGNPLGLANTVTTGIVSAVNRPVSASSSEVTDAGDVVVTNAIQIDAAINPGNSGGPLFDAQGRVIGITSSIATLSSGGSQSGSIGLGFAIPVNLARAVGEQLIESGSADHAFLGVSLSDGTATADGVTRRGAVVEQVTSGSPAAAAELRSGDVVVAIDGDPVGGAESLTAYVRERQSGEEAELTIVRDGETLTVPVTLAARETSLASSSGSGTEDDGSSEGESQLPGLGLPGAPVPGFDRFGR